MGATFILHNRYLAICWHKFEFVREVDPVLAGNRDRPNRHYNVKDRGAGFHLRTAAGCVHPAPTTTAIVITTMRNFTIVDMRMTI
jgi:hypothetical protein